MATIKIGRPYIEKCLNKKTRLCSNIEYQDGKNKVLYYEVEDEYAKYLSYEKSDCFVLGLLHNCMNQKCDISCEAPVSEQLLFQLKNYYIPILSKNMPDLFFIEIDAEGVLSFDKSEGAVATGNSGGVDSFYTIVKHMNESGSYKLTHLLFNNISTEDDNEERIRQWFNKEEMEKKKIAEELGLKAISLYSNLYSFYESHFIYNYYYAAQYISAPYALDKLINKYYYSSSYSFTDFTINHKKMTDGSNFDLLALDCFSTDRLKVYSTGAETGRIDKTMIISDNMVVNRHLQVCAVEQNKQYNESGVIVRKLNCGCCRKCARTITTLYAIGKLEKFHDIFELEQFNNDKDKYIGCELASDLYEFSNELTDYLRDNQRYTMRIIMWRCLYKIRYVIAKSKILVNLYHGIRRKGKKR
jgi:hypothetical protein